MANNNVAQTTLDTTDRQKMPKEKWLLFVLKSAIVLNFLGENNKLWGVFYLIESLQKMLNWL